jgi:16S rRNA (adenine1518-N6/adenine1519-N6)-dimethyltransferase
MKMMFPKFDVCVSNLPYGISSPITFRLLEHDFRVAILMYQREFAQRMVASPGKPAYSRLTVSVYYKAKCEILEHVPRTAFYPQPEVDSAIVRLSPRKPPFVLESEKFFFDVVNALFSQRRKKIRNSLKQMIRDELRKRGLYTDVSHAKIVGALPFGDLRVGVLTPEELGRLSNELYIVLNNENKI